MRHFAGQKPHCKDAHIARVLQERDIESLCSDNTTQQLLKRLESWANQSTDFSNFPLQLQTFTWRRSSSSHGEWSPSRHNTHNFGFSASEPSVKMPRGTRLAESPFAVKLSHSQLLGKKKLTVNQDAKWRKENKSATNRLSAFKTPIRLTAVALNSFSSHSPPFYLLNSPSHRVFLQFRRSTRLGNIDIITIKYSARTY